MLKFLIHRPKIFRLKKAIRIADFGQQSVSVIYFINKQRMNPAYLSHQTTLERVLVPPWRVRAS